MTMASRTSVHRRLKMCFGLSALLIIILLVVLVVLFLTILKPHQPEITAYAVTLRKIEFGVFPVVRLNVTLDLVVTINNRNYGSFEYKDTKAHVTYNGTVIAEPPIRHDTIPAHGKLNVSTSVEIIADRLVSSPQFGIDIRTGVMNFTSTTILHGRVSEFKILKLHASAFSTCHISVFLLSRNVDSRCDYKLKI